MKITLTAILLFALFSPSFAQKSKKAEDAPADKSELIYRGKKINDSGAITPVELLEQMNGKEKLEAKVVAKIASVCQVKGCWAMVDLENGQQMRVTFKDYGFFLPLDCSGKTVVMEGFAYYKTVSVAQLRHYAEDAGKSQEEIEAITEPEQSLAFEASGVIVK